MKKLYYIKSFIFIFIILSFITYIIVFAYEEGTGFDSPFINTLAIDLIYILRFPLNYLIEFNGFLILFLSIVINSIFGYFLFYFLIFKRLNNKNSVLKK